MKQIDDFLSILHEIAKNIDAKTHLSEELNNFRSDVVSFFGFSRIAKKTRPIIGEKDRMS